MASGVDQWPWVLVVAAKDGGRGDAVVVMLTTSSDDEHGFCGREQSWARTGSARRHDGLGSGIDGSRARDGGLDFAGWRLGLGSRQGTAAYGDAGSLLQRRRRGGGTVGFAAAELKRARDCEDAMGFESELEKGARDGGCSVLGMADLQVKAWWW
ncbi:hypothetical protein M0R45_030615 [Rubus argutus]|uniref:Uncharacterized protein n=1 Tax=Rubus argutus TaxID=59490 RepID=A0AAW1WDP9_RUBAR